MFERYLTDALTKHFGHLVEDVDVEKVRLSAWNGRLVLEDVFLRTDALDGFVDKCPVELAYGKVGRLDIQVPWTLVGSQLWKRKTTKQQQQQQQRSVPPSPPQGKEDDEQGVNRHQNNETAAAAAATTTTSITTNNNVSVTLSDVNILITPRRKGSSSRKHNNNQSVGSTNKEEEEEEEANNAMNDDKVQRKARERKERVVQELLDGQLLSRVALSSSQVTSSSRSWQWVQEWLSELLSSLTVTARNIHIRYEDPGHSMGFVWNSNNNTATTSKRLLRRYRKEFAIGITLSEFSVSTAEEQKVEMKKDVIAAKKGSIPIESSSSARDRHLSDDDDGDGDDNSQSTTTTTKGEMNSEISIPSTELATPEKQSDDQDEERSSSSSKPTTTTYTMRSKIAATKTLAIYWDTNGCILMSQGAQTAAAVAADQQQQGDFKVEERAYLDNAFSILNNGVDTITSQEEEEETKEATIFADKALYERPHTYILDPVSPTVRFDLVTENEMTDAAYNDETNNNNNGGGASSSPPTTTTTTNNPRRSYASSNKANNYRSIPSSSVNIYFPPTLFFVSRHTLEDIAYLRKSLDAWMHTKKGILSDRTLRKLASLRPIQSAVHNPSGWWKYAIEATIAFIKVGRQQDSIHGKQHTIEEQESSSSNVPHQTSTSKKNRGWLGLARALGKRRQYVALYEELYYNSEQQQQQSEHPEVVYGPVLPTVHRAHQLLLELEDELSAPEIVAFRIAAYNQLMLQHAKEENGSGDNSVTKRWHAGVVETDTNHFSSLDNPALDYLSLEHRCQMFAEMAEALDRERLNKEFREQEEESTVELDDMEGFLGPSVSNLEEDPTVWKISLSCAELSLQINDQKQTKRMDQPESAGSVPIARLSCACLLKIELYGSSSWEMDCAIASLTMQDLANRGQNHQEDYFHWGTLVGPKLIHGMPSVEADLVNVDGNSFQESIRVVVRRNRAPGQMGTTTYTRVRLSPLEVVYSTLPYEALTRVLTTVQTPELADDYHRMASRVFEWRERQKKRFLQALAHKGKIMYINVDVTAPVLLIPEAVERADSPLLVIDLGQLKFSNATNDERPTSLSDSSQFDDAWQLVLKNVQVQCSTTMLYRNMRDHESSGSQETEQQSPQQVIEGFSIEFSILTMVADEGDEARIKVAAKLPRLRFNITSSSLRLINRLRSQWSQRKYELKTEAFSKTRQVPQLKESDTDNDVYRIETSKADMLSPIKSNQRESKQSARYFEFHFTAPLIAVKLENDVDGRIIPAEWANRSMKTGSTPIVSLSVRGIRGSLQRTVDTTGSASTSFEARLQSLLAVDHYQTAGSPFSLLLSSKEPGSVLEIAARNHEELLHKMIVEDQSPLPHEGEDLVFVEYTAREEVDPLLKESDWDKLSIQFHELYLEWNPETIAALWKAVGTPTITQSTDDISCSTPSKEDALSDDEFFDAEEDFFFDSNAGSFEGQDIMATPLSYMSRESTTSLLSPRRSTASLPSSNFENTTSQPEHRRFELVFNLSKLCVNFNKDSRHRRLVTAEMDRTFIQYQTDVSGGSRTIARLGNLIMSDPTSAYSETLYAQILGLQNDSTWKSSSELLSLLDMEIISNPKTRQTKDIQMIQDANEVQSVSICYDNGFVYGSDTFMKAHLSPMRFVYLSQLWSEVVDYVFEGIMGYEVMGKQRPEPSSSSELKTDCKSNSNHQLHADIDPYQISFTKFDISMESPVVLFPVTYRSPQFIKLFASSIRISNYFQCNRYQDQSDISRWHNNCNITFHSLRIFTWDGKEISHSKRSVKADINVRWPVGPLATQEIPKWNVSCTLDSLEFTVLTSHYALLQNIATYNISEESRNLDEWDALQNLTAEELRHYKDSIMIHYGYDLKDVAPTTYLMKIGMPLVSVALEAENGLVVAIAKCSNFRWKMEKGDSHISRQEITCNIEMVHPKADSETEILLSFNQSERQEGKFQSELTYTSTSDPSGNNVKTLDIINPCIYMSYPGWMELMGWFADPPEAEVLSVEEVKQSIQIGDRWYRITKTPGKTGEEEANSDHRNFSWIGKEGHNIQTVEQRTEESPKPSFQLHVLLSSPCIVFSAASAEGGTNHVVLRLSHLDFLHTNDSLAQTVTKSFFLHDLQLNTSSSIGSRYAADDQMEKSLLLPWCVAGTIKAGNGQYDCATHSVRINADVLRARAAFSEMIVALNVSLGFVSDVRQTKAAKGNAKTAQSNEGADTTCNSDTELVSKSSTPIEASSLGPRQYITTLVWEGFELLVVDDSGRHFAGSQELITLVLGRMQFWRQQDTLLLMDQTSKDQIRGASRMTAQLERLDLLDLLQPETSQFRKVAAIRSSKHPYENEEKECEDCKRPMGWIDFAMQSSSWGFLVSPSFLRLFPFDDSQEVASLKAPAIVFDSFDDGGKSQAYSVKVGVCHTQYNPSTVIALQRFMGRFRKQAVKSIGAFNEEFDKLMEESYEVDPEETQDPSEQEGTDIRIKMKIHLDDLSICLNKEHQHRRLLRVSLSDCEAEMNQHKDCMALEGGLGDLSAWDCDFNWPSDGNKSRNVDNSCIIKALPSKEAAQESTKSNSSFLKYRYQTFTSENPFCHADHVVPDWVLAHLASEDESNRDIDDCLEVSMGSVQITHLRERTEEIIDYLSNGLPGKGMGATSKAAQGFLEKRIKTRSFLHVLIQSPSVLIPQHKLAPAGLQLQLGDIDLSSWFEGGSTKGRVDEIDLGSGVSSLRAPKPISTQAEDHADWWRMLSLKIANFSARMFERTNGSFLFADLLNQPFDLSLVLQKSAWHSSFTLRCKVSLVDMMLRYSHYHQIHLILQGNLGQTVDTQKWNNIEKDYDREVKAAQVLMSKPVEYASGARHVRFGNKKREDSNQSHPENWQTVDQGGTKGLVDLQFQLEGFSLKFRRDDSIVKSEPTSAHEYDMLLMKVQLVEIAVSNKISDEYSFQLSLYRIGLFDLGDRGRLNLAQVDQRDARRPCAFTVLVEGYSSEAEQVRTTGYGDNQKGKKTEPQLVVSVDTVPASSVGTIGSLDNPVHQQCGSEKVTIAKIVLNHLSVNALVRPFTELADFLSLSWNPVEVDGDNLKESALEKQTKKATSNSDSSSSEQEQEQNDSGPKVESSTSHLQLKLVAHYPRIFFVADESDLNSRALVLRGLAVVNAGYTKKTVANDHACLGVNRIDKQANLVVDAQLHSLESYINNDVSKALALQKRHQQLLTAKEIPLFAFPAEEYSDQVGMAEDGLLGIALLQPVTSGIEFGRTSRSRFPPSQFLCVNVEPISTMLSFSDLQLIESVLNRWMQKPASEHPNMMETDPGEARFDQPLTTERTQDDAGQFLFDVVFFQEHLGLGLRKQGDHVVVDEVLGNEGADIRVGDKLLRIAGKNATTSLDDIVVQLAGEVRPTTLTFLRPTTPAFKAHDKSTLAIDPQMSPVGPTPREVQDKVHSSQNKMILHFNMGAPNGLFVDKSSVAGIPVVTAVNQNIATAIVASQMSPQLFPRTGALVTEIDGKNIIDLDFADAQNFISSNGIIDEKDNIGTQSQTYSLTFVEIEASCWGVQDCFDLSMQGGVLTFIDDLNGRDMPLMRGTLKTAEIHLKRGIGLRTFILERIRDLSCLMGNANCKNIGADSSITLTAFAKTTLEYFHPRNGVYEPLLEPAQICFNYECHYGNEITGRPGHVALEVSDHLLRDMEPKDYEPHLICMNISDSSVEVLAEALQEWQSWRKMVQDSYSLSVLPEELPGNDAQYTSGSSNWTGSQIGTVAGPATMNHSVGVNDEGFDGGTLGNLHQTQQVAASNAAQAAFVFAQKRGAEKSGKSEFSKPFVFRNRTGVSIAFVQQESTISSGQHRRRNAKGQHLFVGEYGGLEHYDWAEVTELADGEDARFQMDVLGHAEMSKKVRTYDGQLPHLKVAIQAIAGLVVNPIADLQVQKAGISIRHLSVNKIGTTERDCLDVMNSGTSRYLVPVVWTVEVEDNRRILTLSSAVRLISLNSTVGIEIGVQHGKKSQNSGDSNNIELLGVSLPDSPYYLPIWLAMRRDVVRVHVRPKFGGPSEYHWGKQSVLKFSPMEDTLVSSTTQVSSTIDWIWQDTLEDALGSIECRARQENAPAAFLSCFSSALAANKGERAVQTFNSSENLGPDEIFNEILSISIDSGLSLRNLLPVDVEWEAAHGFGPDMQSAVDGSTLRFQESFSETTALRSGEYADVYACNFKLESLKTRFKITNMEGWSQWAIVSSPLQEESATIDGQSDEVSPANLTESLSAFQTNVQISDAFGVPVTIGVRVVPKIEKSDRDESNLICYGVDVIIYSELWISNLTSLPLTFGCPERQIYAKGDDDFHEEEEATKFSAEAALMEMASVLEIGEKGTTMDTRTANLQATAGEVYILPHQQILVPLSAHVKNSLITEEIFEFIEIDSSTVKRRWWASESYWNLRNSEILDLRDGGKSWHWIDDEWKIDYAGRSLDVTGGWESCNDLLGIGEGPFSGHRLFKPTHPFRRRRWFRSRASNPSNAVPAESVFDQPEMRGSGPTLLPGLQAFHHPIVDSFSRAQNKARQRKKRKSTKSVEKERETKGIDTNTYKVSIKCGDGKWSVPVTISSLGTNHGDIQVYASRWPTLTRSMEGSAQQLAPVDFHEGLTSRASPPLNHGLGPLNATLYELVYQVKEVEGEWGDFSKHMMVSARFSIRNDSEEVTMEVKQAGTNDESALVLSPGEISPFYWSDFRLPKLVCIRPANTSGNAQDAYKWSGGFDASNLGMTALLIRKASGCTSSLSDSEARIRSIRTLVELRPGTGGAGFNVSFKEEPNDGEGALFRIENMSTFSVWLLQDGVLANPSMSLPHDTSELDGDPIRPGERLSFGLSIPFRQGKYAHRRAATMAELLRVRVGLAPLSTRAGIETTKVIGLSVIGESTRLKPAKLVTVLSTEQRKMLERVRILAITATDGPSRVLKFMPMAYPQVENVLGSALMESVTYAPPDDLRATGPHVDEIIGAASITETMLIEKKLPSEIEAKRRALFGNERDRKSDALLPSGDDSASKADTQFSVRFAFSGFLFSFIDSSPSEICTIAVDNINAIVKWNQLRTRDASLLMSIGWLQVDNHVPSAPFPVAVCPDGTESRESGDDVVNPTGSGTKQSGAPPVLFVGVEIAPEHSSGIVCLKSVTVALRSMVVSLDLAFLVRLQRFASGLQMQLKPQKVLSVEVSQKGRAGQQLLRTRAIPTPDIYKRIQEVTDAAATGVGRQQVFFQVLAVLPYTIKLSVAPARALTPAQAAFEGAEAAAIHKAVRKGDFFVGRNSYPLGLVLGRKNKTALSVAQGVFKSIVVDALIRMDGASLNLAGAFLRNQIFYGPQLATYLAAHYMYSLKQNVPALLGSMAAFGNPVGLFRGIGDGVNDFVSEPVKGMKKSIARLDPKYLVDGVAKGTGSLARHTVGGFADSAALLTSTFSKNMAVLTLDRRYAQKRDRGISHQLEEQGDFLLLDGVESGFVKLAQGFIEGVTGVVKAPMRGAERNGFEGFAKGLGKGLLGLLVKPMIGISDAATDVFIGVKSSVEGDGSHVVDQRHQVRPRRALYGWERQLRIYNLADAAACALMLRTCLGGQSFLSHLDMDDRVALLSDKRLLLLDSEGQKILLVKFKHISSVEVRQFGDNEWTVLIMLNTLCKNGSEVEVINSCKNEAQAQELRDQINHGIRLLENHV